MVQAEAPKCPGAIGAALFQDEIAMVSPWMDSGNLLHYLKTNPTADRCKLCTQIAEGLAYMHDENAVHGDVKPDNVLISPDGVAVLADFGSATLTYDATIQIAYSSAPSTPTQDYTLRYAAPELLIDQTKTMETDAYALGMTILVIISGERPYSGKSDFMILQLVTMKREKPSRPEESIPTTSESGNLLWELLVKTWDYNPKMRPKAMEILSTIKRITLASLSPQGNFSD